MYDYLIVTNQPAFYKINLYNEISKKLKIKVIYLGNGSIIRNKDFISGKMNFEYEFLSELEYENRNKFKNIIKLISIIKSTNYKRILIGGWDELENWITMFISSSKKNCVVVESSIFESKVKGLKGFLKKIFLKRINYGYVSGEDQKKVLEALNFKGKIIKTYGVGLMNFQQQKIKVTKENSARNFLYVGRLSKEKNLEYLIKIFNELNYELGIVGSGPEEEYLKKISNKNIKFYGYVDNKVLPGIYTSYDVFILPSKSEPWGLVVEEALYYGLPVIVSNRVGCRSEIVEKYDLGLTFKLNGNKNLIKKIKELDGKRYNEIKNKVKIINFNKIKEKQINSYLIEEKNEKRIFN